MKKTIFMLCLSLIAPAAYAQNKNRLNMKKTEISKPPYVLGRYMIDPDNKQIGVYEMFGGVTWDGFRYRPSEKYNYKTTTLCFLGNKVFFTEDLDGVDINLLQLLYDGEKYIVFGDNKAIYKRYSHNNYNEKIDLTDYTHVTGFLYKDGNNNLFTIPYMTSTFRLEEVQGLPDLDLETIQHVACNYYTDKNGLYYLGYHDEYSISNSKLIKESVKLEDSGGKLITPVIHKRYFIYAKSVYAVNELSEYTKLELNPSRIKELPLHTYYGRYVITDGNNTYYTIMRQSLGYHGYSTSERFDKEIKENLPDDFYWKGVDKWKTVNNSIFNFGIDDDGSFYFPGVDKPFRGQQNNYTIVHTPKGYYAFNSMYGRNLKKVNKLYIRNYDTKKYEELDLGKFHYINFECYVYKNRLYSYGGRPVKETIGDVNALRFITQGNGDNTNFITDGDCLIYAGEAVTGYAIDKSDGDERLVYGEKQNTIRYDINIHKLKAVSKNILYDGQNIITYGRNGIEIIPVHKLGFKVKIFI